MLMVYRLVQVLPGSPSWTKSRTFVVRFKLTL